MLLCTTRFHSSACHCFLIFLNLFCPLQASNFLFFLVGTNQFERHSFEFLAQELGRRGHKVVTVKPILIPEESRLVCENPHRGNWFRGIVPASIIFSLVQQSGLQWVASKPEGRNQKTPFRNSARRIFNDQTRNPTRVIIVHRVYFPNHISSTEEKKSLFFHLSIGAKTRLDWSKFHVFGIIRLLSIGMELGLI